MTSNDTGDGRYDLNYKPARSASLDVQLSEQQLVANLKAGMKSKQWNVEAVITATKYLATGAVGVGGTLLVQYLW